jgi:hypothetical protein
VRESSENANGIMDTLYYCCCPFYSFPQRVFQVADAFCPTPYPHFFSSSFSILFIFCLFFGVCVCFFISGTAIHRTRDTKSECPLYFSQKLCDGQQPRTFFPFFPSGGFVSVHEYQRFSLVYCFFFRDPSKIQS